jgi:hypothetical protein
MMNRLCLMVVMAIVGGDGSGRNGVRGICADEGYHYTSRDGTEA